MAAMAALRHFKKEEVEVRGDEVTVVSILRRKIATAHKSLMLNL